MKFEWETIFTREESGGAVIHGSTRAKVHGGWIVRSLSFTTVYSTVSTAESSVFIPDPNHEWVID